MGLISLVASGCGLQDVSGAGQALEDAGYEVHELRLEEGGLVTAELERPGEPIEDAHFEQAAAIIRDNMEDTAVEAEIRMRDPDDTDRIENFGREQLQRASGG